ncbi:MAG: cytochrome P450 [Actinomycetales bacterium]|nr:cytochrome P450 [Actinomycetales bacterium]
MRPDDVDLSDLDVFERNGAWPLFDVLRDQEPLHWNPEPSPNHGFWALTRHADVAAVTRDEETFSSEVGGANLEELDEEQIEVRKSMLETDGARHWALRRLLQHQFTPRGLVGYEAFLRGLTRTTIDAALAKGEFDFVKEVSADFPIRVLARMLDVPDERTGQLIEWGNRMVGNSDPDYADVLADSAESEEFRLLPFRSPAALEVFEYGFELAAQRKGKDGDDLVSRLVNQVPEDGLPLSERDFRNYFLLLVVAGNETTRHAISHSMKALIDHPDQLALLQAEPERIPGAVEELLRWASPIYHFRRTAMRDVEMYDKTIKAGDKVVVWFASGNRDDRVFDDPYRFDVTRTRVDHVTFGKGGPHFCLGNQLARMEIRIMFEELLPRLTGGIALTGDVTRVRSNFVNGIKKFPVTVS